MRLAMRTAALAIGLLGSGGGAMAQALEDLSPASIRQQVKPGDAVRAAVQDGRTFELTVVAVEQETLTGTTAENRRFRIRYSALASLEITGKAAAAAEVVALPPAADANAWRGWFGLNAGLVAGDVKVPCGDPSASDCSEGGWFSSFGLNLTFAGPMAVRLRAVRANEDTEDPPLELAALVGPHVGNDFYLMLGASNVSHPDDDFEGGDADGVAWELLFAPRTLSGAGVEISLHGAQGSDLDYQGVSIGFRFGN